MIELDRLIAIYKEGKVLPHTLPFDNPDDVLVSTITYLIAFKQVHQMLKNLAGAIQGVDLEVYGP